MNDSTLTELKILVERAVRPLLASSSRKRKMREELLAHVQAVFEDEHAELGDERLALERTERRFGDPVELTGQLRQSVPWFDWLIRLLERSGDVFFPRFGESGLRRAFRQSLWLSIYLMSITLISCPLLFLLIFFLTWDNTPAIRVREIMLGLAGAMLALCFMVLVASSVIFLAHWMWHAMYGPARSWIKTLCVAAVSSLVGAFWVCCFVNLAELADGRSHESVLRLLPAWVVIVPYCLIFGANLRWRFLFAAVARSWLQTVLFHSASGLVIASLVFAANFAMTLEFWSSFENGRLVLVVTATWLAPIDLICSSRRFTDRARSDREWCNLPIDNPSGATA